MESTTKTCLVIAKNVSYFERFKLEVQMSDMLDWELKFVNSQ